MEQASRVVVGCDHKGRAAAVASVPNVGGIAQPATRGLPDRQRSLGALRDQPPFLLGQSGVEVQHERIGIPARLYRRSKVPELGWFMTTV
jgi:hypothetical protein